MFQPFYKFLIANLISKPNFIPSIQNGMASLTTKYQEAFLTIPARRWPKKASCSKMTWQNTWSDFNPFFQPILKVFIMK